MKLRSLLLAALVAALAFANCRQILTAQSSFSHQVSVASGAIAGSAKDGVLAFKGIPYAASPAGDLRWRAPQPPLAWKGVRDGSLFGHDCMQIATRNHAPEATYAEDCLYLNVWRPAEQTAKKLPVMVWIHGGAFINGGSSDFSQDGSKFAQQGIVFVSLNYRLGRLGFFAFPALSKENPGEPHGNYGLMDQIAALQWIQKNIAAFGGDAQRVTVFGESAGGSSVQMLMASPLAKGLFQQVILQSSGARTFLDGMSRISEEVPGHPSAEKIGVNFAVSQGIAGEDAAALAKLRALPAEQLASGLDKKGFGTPAVMATYSQPMIDGMVVKEDAREAMLAGRAARVAVMSGATSADLGQAAAPSKDALFDRFGSDRAKAVAAYDPQGEISLPLLSAMVGGDANMVEPARMYAAKAAALGLPAYEYRFSYVTEAQRAEFKNGVTHGRDVVYTFDNLALSGPPASPLDNKVAHTFNVYLANFVKTGNPNGPGLPVWPRYSAQKDELMDFTWDGTPVPLADPRKARLDLVAGRKELFPAK
jgi:para-nitrobenzyl esterase